MTSDPRNIIGVDVGGSQLVTTENVDEILSTVHGYSEEEITALN